MTVVVTGSSRGIGLAIAEAFHNNGHTLIINGRNENTLNAVADKLKNAVPVAADVSKPNEAERLINAAERVDVLINNAGIAHYGLFQDMTSNDMQSLINTNIMGALNCSRFVVPQMIRRKKGCIINISSIWGERGASCEAIYSLTKGGINAFTKSLAKELGPSGIRVNAIACGLIDTDMNARFSQEEINDMQIPLLRQGKPEEVASLACFLASEAAAYITGQVITIDGGLI